MQRKWLKYGLVGLLLLTLVFIRAIGKNIFYDPLQPFFHHANFQSLSLPDHIDQVKLLGNIALRFSLNSIVSIFILLLLFTQKKLKLFLVGVYSFGLITFLFLFYYFLNQAELGEYLGLFYVRRMLLHPVLLLILVPALYFQQSAEKQKQQAS